MRPVPPLAGIMLLAVAASTAAASEVALWPGDVAVTTAPGDQGLAALLTVRDAEGGAFVVWEDSARARVFVQRLDRSGMKVWPEARRVASTPFEKLSPAAVEDGAGGVIVAWAEQRGDVTRCTYSPLGCDVYAQRLSPAGEPLWGAGGAPVFVAPGDQGTGGIAAAADGAGGAFVVWHEQRDSRSGVNVQHLASDGAALWGFDMRVSRSDARTSQPRVVSDSAGGAIVAWLSDEDRLVLRAQRLTAVGAALWPADGVVAGMPGTERFAMASDARGGALFAFTVWTDVGNLAVRRVDARGRRLWEGVGVTAGVASFLHDAPDVIADGHGGAIVAWVDHLDYGERNVLAQRINAAGERKWGTRGRRVSDLPGAQDNPRAIGDGEGGAIVVWRDCRDYLERDPCFAGANVYGQHLTIAGQPLWAFQGAPISKARGSQAVVFGTSGPENSIAITTDGAGGAIVAWPDGRRDVCLDAGLQTECDVFAQRVNDGETALTTTDLAVTQTAGQAAGAAGDVTFTIRVSNQGPGTATGVKVLNPFPPHLALVESSPNLRYYRGLLMFAVRSLPAGSTKAAWFVGRPYETGPSCSTATAYAETFDPMRANNTARACLTLP